MLCRLEIGGLLTNCDDDAGEGKTGKKSIESTEIVPKCTNLKGAVVHENLG